MTATRENWLCSWVGWQTDKGRQVTAQLGHGDAEDMNKELWPKKFGRSLSGKEVEQGHSSQREPLASGGGVYVHVRECACVCVCVCSTCASTVGVQVLGNTDVCLWNRLNR